MSEKTIEEICGFPKGLFETKVDIGYAVMTGNSEEFSIGHIIEIDKQGFHVYYGGREGKVVFDGLTIKRARQLYVQRFENVEHQVEESD